MSELQAFTLDQRLKRIERMLEELIRPKPHWVKARVITKLTGWDNQKMRQARNGGVVKWKKGKDGIWYDLNSLHPHLIKKEQTIHESPTSTRLAIISLQQALVGGDKT